MRFAPGANDEGVVRFLLTAGAIGTLYKKNASISGADMKIKYKETARGGLAVNVIEC
ncbi:MAG: hypothetical protein R6W76_18390 [Caldilinea sp.]